MHHNYFFTTIYDVMKMVLFMLLRNINGTGTLLVVMKDHSIRALDLELYFDPSN